MRTIAPCCLVFLAGAVLPAGAGPARFEKGRDVEAIARADSLERSGALARERERRAYRSAFRAAMRLDEFDQDCVAQDPVSGACLLTVGEFNRRAEDWESPPPDPASAAPGRKAVEAARRRLLTDLLRDMHPLQAARESGAADSLEELLRRKSREKWERKAGQEGDSVLRDLYAEHHARLFAAREERRYRALASSDSLLADSLWRVVAAAQADSSRASPAARALPWRPVPFASLPPSLRTSALALLPGEPSRPLRAPFGFVILELASLRRIPETRFADALPVLLALANRPERGDLNVERSLIEHYRAHAGEYRTPDTAIFRAWLLPGARSLASLKDTAGVRPCLVADWELPAEVGGRLGEASAYRPGDVIGPMKALFGTWIFKTVAIRPGGRRLSLEQARPRILERLFGSDSPDPVALALAEVRSKEDDLRKHIASGLALRRVHPSDRELEGLLRSPQGDSLLASMPEDAPAPERERLARAALGEAEAARRMARSREDWIRRRLSVRFIDLEAGE